MDSDVTARQSSLSQYALVSIPLGRRDLNGIGESLSWTRFDLDHAARSELEVLSAALPRGMGAAAIAQLAVAGFVAPLGHHTPGESRYWGTLGGVFARNVRGDRFAWAVGAYFDVSPLEDFYTPYLGATHIINEPWTLNAIVPWPSITYAPTTQTVLRLGVVALGSFMVGRTRRTSPARQSQQLELRSRRGTSHRSVSAIPRPSGRGRCAVTASTVCRHALTDLDVGLC